MDLAIFSFHTLTPLKSLGLTNAFWGINIDTLGLTWLSMAVLFLGCWCIIRNIRKNPNGILAFGAKYTTKTLVGLTIETLGSFNESCFTTAFGLFAFIFSCTIVSLIPHPEFEEATRDLNTALAIGLISFISVQIQAFKAHGIGHLKEYTHPFVFMVPMHIVGDLAKITSMSFRLFGNILAGSVILSLMFLVLERFFLYVGGYFISLAVVFLIMYFLRKINPKYTSLSTYLPVVSSFFFALAGIQIFFGLFEGLIQAGVVALLTLTYTGMAINADHES